MTVELVKKIAGRMRDPEKVKEILLNPDNRNPDPLNPAKLNPFLNDFVLMQELPGAVLLLAELDHLFPDEQWDEAIHAYVLKMKEMIEHQVISSL